MVVLSPSFILGLVVLFYLCSFVLFAVVRIATGVSIQRIGYLSLRHIAYTPRDGIRIDLRGLGLHIHRPTFARPTWISLRLTELKVTVDLTAVGRGKDAAGSHRDESADGPSCVTKPALQTSKATFSRRSSSTLPRSQTWKQLTQMKERIKGLHEKIHWLRMVDVEVLNSSCVIKDIATAQIGSLTMTVDTRRKTVDRGRLFRHKKVPAGEQRPAEWVFVVKSVLFTPEAKESIEIIDICSLNVHGLLYRDLAGLRDASISLKLGRIHVPYDDLKVCYTRIEHCRYAYSQADQKSSTEEISMIDVMDELEVPGSREEEIVQTVSDSKEFISSILRGVQEIQLAVSFIGLSKAIPGMQPSNRLLYLNFAMNEFGIDLYRLDQKSPAHRMYFSARDIAHQALLAAISIAVSVDDGDGKPERLLYIPMATTTVKTTLPSRTIADSEGNDAAERNANMLFANLVITSPSLDLDLKHTPMVMALLRRQPDNGMLSGPSRQRHHLISRLLPKASVKFSIHEPVARVVLPSMDESLQGPDDYDLLISSISSISLDSESSHSSSGEMHYSLTSNMRISSHQFYYQAGSGARHNLLLSDALELKVQLHANPEVYVIVSGNLQTLAAQMIRPDISTGLHQVIQHLTKGTAMSNSNGDHGNALATSVLRRLPFWLVHVHFQGSNFSIQLAGTDPGVSRDARGVAIRLESWAADYKIKKDSANEDRPLMLRSLSRMTSGAQKPSKHKVYTTSPSSTHNMTDGRRLAIHAQGLDGFAGEGAGCWETEPFMSIPKFEIAYSTSTDSKGPVLHVNSHLRAIYINYSLYRYYALEVARGVLDQAFTQISHQASGASSQKEEDQTRYVGNSAETMNLREMTTIDIKATFLQIKATMPYDPSMMLQAYGIEAGRHRWAAPFLKSKTIRLCVQAPQLKNAWSRIISIRLYRMDIRESRRKIGKHYVAENSIDLTTEFVRLAVPHQLVLHKVFDNLANVVKATEQLHHRFKSGTDEYILNKPPEEPRQVPRVSFRSKVLLFELEDGSFDWKLGLIYRVGLIEQQQRLAREEAYRLKVKKLEEHSQRRDTSRYRTQPSLPNGRGRAKRSELGVTRERSKSSHSKSRRTSSSPPGNRGRRMRYDPEGVSGLTGAAKVSAQDAWLKLQQHNAQSWRKRIMFAKRYQNSSMRKIRGLFTGSDELPDNLETAEAIVAIPDRPGLMATLLSDLHIVMDKPSFPIHEYPNYLHSVGKGMPIGMKYSLLIPMSLQINMGEVKVTLRDYPLPLLHVPAIKLGQSTRIPSWSLKTDFVIAEEYRDSQSTKQVSVQIIPPEKITSPADIKNGFCVDVHRTISPIKTYSNVDIAINTSNPTSMTWGTSYQPAIQDMMQIIEGFTKPQIDPSDRVGFWDKIRLSFHSRVKVAWKGDGDVLLKLKGSRDPYVVTGHGAGFVMCWRENVRWNIRQDDDPKKFMAVSSGEYVMAIPDYSHEVRNISPTRGNDTMSLSSTTSIPSTSSQRHNAMFKKVVMKLSGNVRWLAGLVFERDLDDGGRSFSFNPHYEVTLKNPRCAKEIGNHVYDAFRGFRSQHIHLSIAVVAPVDRDWSVTNLKPSSSYNSIHMTPRFFTHFLDWWSLFSGVMSLPVRQGRLFPGVEKSSKKFGRHLATIKYSLLLSPLFISHIYKHKDAEDYSADTVGATGLKLRIDSFMLDLHQRREEFSTQGKGRLRQTKTSAMRINQAQLDFISADIRAVSASIAGTSADDIKRATDEDLAALQDQTSVTPDTARFTIPDLDYLWIDMDDFVELDWILPAETHPETKIMPLAFAPRFTYFRQTDLRELASGDPGISSPFGDEPTHYCIMSQDNDPRSVQAELFKDRISVLRKQFATHQRILGEQELRVVRDGSKDPSLKDHFNLLSKQGEVLEEKRSFLEAIINDLSARVGHDTSQADMKDDMTGFKLNAGRGHPKTLSVDPQGEPLVDFASDFNNRFIVHNVQLKWNNSLRNIILRYVHQVSQRRGFVYYMSRRAVKFILDIVDEQRRSKEKNFEQSEQQASTGEPSPSVSYTPKDKSNQLDLEERIQELLSDGKAFVNAVDNEPEQSPKHASEGLGLDISEEFTPQNSYHVRLIAPQIQLQSEKNAKAVLAVTAKGMELKVVQIMDKTRIADDVSGLVQRRFSLDMDGVQFFVTTQKALTKFMHLYSANRYGSPKGSAWPPWVPIEVNFDFKLNPFGWSRVVQKTSASLRYDKYNTLRLKYNDEVNKGEAGHSHDLEDPERRIDHLWVEFPHIRAICDSTQYYAMYLIVLDLLLYSEPLEKVRSERLEKIMLAADFSDLSGAPEMVVSLQERIRQLEEIKMHFQLHEKFLDRQGWQDRLIIEQDLTSCEDELFFMMKAITTAQRKHDDRSQTAQSNGLLRWYLSASEIVWHLMRDKNDPLMEIQLKHAAYDRTDNSDGSNYNTLEIARIHGLNLLRDALYPEMFAPYFENGQSFADNQGQDIKMLKVQWYMLEAIAGIPVLDQFEVNLFPLRVQLEREAGVKLFEYIFPNNAEHGGPSPFMVKHKAVTENEDEDSEADASSPTTPISVSPESAETQPSTRSGSLEIRLRPTMGLSDSAQRNGVANAKMRAADTFGVPSESHRFKLFHGSNRSKSATRSQASLKLQTERTISRRRSGESLRSLGRSATGGSFTNMSSMNGNSEKVRRFGLHRTTTKDTLVEKEKASDDLSQMMSRASNYMTLAYVRIPSVVLCLSYKGRGERNIEDVHNFVFRMPTLEYRNKTWSNLDLALRLKKDVIKALISHTGAIIGNKLSHHRPNKNQQSRLREIANSSSLLPHTDSIPNVMPGLATFIPGRAQSTERPIVAHSNFIAGWGSQISRTNSEASSLDNMISPGNKAGQSTHTMTTSTSSNSNDVYEPSLVEEPEDGISGEATVEQNHNRFLRNAFTQRVINEGVKLRHRDTNGAAKDTNGGSTDTDERSRKATVIHLGKKILGSLN